MHSMTSGPLAGKTQMAGAKISWEAASFTWLVPEPEGPEGPAGTVTWSIYTWPVRVTRLLTAQQPGSERACLRRKCAFQEAKEEAARFLLASPQKSREVTGSHLCCVLLLQVSHQGQPRFKGKGFDWSSWWRGDRVTLQRSKWEGGRLCKIQLDVSALALGEEQSIAPCTAPQGERVGWLLSLPPAL